MGQGEIEERQREVPGEANTVLVPATPVHDEDIMRLALEQAAAAARHGDVPVGAVVVRDGKVLGAAGNERELRADPTAHAEILALRAAARAAETWRLEGATVYVTLEPCVMCAGALVSARVRRLVYGPQDHRAGAALSLYNVVADPRLNHEIEVTTGVLADTCAQLLRAFFEDKRGAGSADPQDQRGAGSAEPHKGKAGR
jgi:tRNA(adenine34) deaminase